MISPNKKQNARIFDLSGKIVGDSEVFVTEGQRRGFKPTEPNVVNYWSVDAKLDEGHSVSFRRRRYNIELDDGRTGRILLRRLIDGFVGYEFAFFHGISSLS